MGISLMILFILLGFQFGIITMILGHVMFCTPYVIIAIMPKLKQIGPEIIDASFDLGATPFQTLRKVMIPAIKPGIIAGAAMAFAMSFDDFIISYFIGGSAENISV
jgi:spermidine/putrescine transport system permease protein